MDTAMAQAHAPSPIVLGTAAHEGLIAISFVGGFTSSLALLAGGIQPARMHTLSQGGLRLETLMAQVHAIFPNELATAPRAFLPPLQLGAQYLWSWHAASSHATPHTGALW